MLGKKWIMYSLLMIGMILWGFSFIWYKVAYQWFLPITVVWFRLTVSSSLLFLFSWLFKKLQRIEKQDFRIFFLAALFEPFLYFIGESFGMTLVSSTLASLIIATIPLFTPLAASYFYKEQLSLLNYIGLAISLIGVGFVVMSNESSNQSSWAGIALIFLAVFAAVAYTLTVKKLTEKYNPFTIVSWQNAIGAVLFAPLFFAFDWSAVRGTRYPFEAFIPLIKLTLFASILAFVFFVNAIRAIGASRANMFTNAIPVFTAVFAWLILDESLGWWKVTGILIVIVGIVLSQAGSFRRMKIWMIFKGQE